MDSPDCRNWRVYCLLNMTTCIWNFTDFKSYILIQFLYVASSIRMIVMPSLEYWNNAYLIVGDVEEVEFATGNGGIGGNGGDWDDDVTTAVVWFPVVLVVVINSQSLKISTAGLVPSRVEQLKGENCSLKSRNRRFSNVYVYAIGRNSMLFRRSTSEATRLDTCTGKLGTALRPLPAQVTTTKLSLQIHCADEAKKSHLDVNHLPAEKARVELTTYACVNCVIN